VLGVGVVVVAPATCVVAVVGTVVGAGRVVFAELRVTSCKLGNLTVCGSKEYAPTFPDVALTKVSLSGLAGF
jgi:hypothetical protein